MAITKSGAVLHNNVTLTASSGDTTATAVDITDSDESAVYIKLTNGATGPTIAAQCQIQTSPDNSNWYNFGGPLQGGVANSGVYSWSGIRLPPGAAYVRTVSGSNTGQNVTIRAEVVEYLKT
jgi:hypothetical protein